MVPVTSVPIVFACRITLPLAPSPLRSKRRWPGCPKWRCRNPKAAPRPISTSTLPRIRFDTLSRVAQQRLSPSHPSRSCYRRLALSSVPRRAIPTPSLPVPEITFPSSATAVPADRIGPDPIERGRFGQEDAVRRQYRGTRSRIKSVPMQFPATTFSSVPSP